MSDNYQQAQAGFEWREQEEQHWFANNIIEPQASTEQLATAKPIIDQMLSDFDSIFGQSKESI